MPYAPETNTGHGHVWERPDGIKARCGGARLCGACARDLADKMRKAEHMLASQVILAARLVHDIKGLRRKVRHLTDARFDQDMRTGTEVVIAGVAVSSEDVDEVFWGAARDLLLDKLRIKEWDIRKRLSELNVEVDDDDLQKMAGATSFDAE